MSEALPHRAKPQLLHKIARFIRDNGGKAHKTEIYDSSDENRKTLRRTMLYGVELGFLEQEGDAFKLTNYGWSLSAHVEYEANEAIKGEFRDAVERFEPYRQVLQVANERDTREVVLDSDVLTQSALKEIAAEIVVEEVENREVNVLIKTADAAGLGEFRAGKKGYESRLIIGDAFDAFVDEMSDKYELPETVRNESKPTPSEAREMPNASDGDVEVKNAESAPGQLKLTVEFDVDDKSSDDIVELVEKVRSAV